MFCRRNDISDERSLSGSATRTLSPAAVGIGALREPEAAGNAEVHADRRDEDEAWRRGPGEGAEPGQVANDGVDDDATAALAG